MILVQNFEIFEATFKKWNVVTFGKGFFDQKRKKEKLEKEKKNTC